MLILTPLYCPTLPNWVPHPITLLTVMPVTPMAAMVSFRMEKRSSRQMMVTLVSFRPEGSGAGRDSSAAGTSPERSTGPPAPSPPRALGAAGRKSA